MPSADRGSVWIVDLGMAAKVRPCLVLSVPTGPQDRVLVTVVAHTTSVQGTQFEVDVNAPFLKPGVFDAQQVLTVPQVKLVRKLGDLTADQLALVEEAVRRWLGLCDADTAQRLRSGVVLLALAAYNRGVVSSLPRYTVPELPEVETVVRDLRPMVVGRRIGLVVRPSGQSLRSPWQPACDQLLRAQVIHAVERRGKWIILRLQGELSLLVHLGMTGQFTVGPAEAPVLTHTHLIFPLEGGPPEEGARQLRFRDVRRFGSATLFLTRADIDAFFAEADLGPEPFDVTPAFWRERLAGTARCIKAVLLDQRVVAGVGNIYADEALFEARLHPAGRASDLNSAEANRLRKAITTVLRRAIEQRGSSIRNYIGGSGLRGGYQEEFRAYGRTGKPCRRCRTAIVSVRLGGRSTHYCPRCQAQSVREDGADGSGSERQAASG